MGNGETDVQREVTAPVTNRAGPDSELKLLAPPKLGILLRLWGGFWALILWVGGGEALLSGRGVSGEKRGWGDKRRGREGGGWQGRQPVFNVELAGGTSAFHSKI